jgi:hypothetical protein
MYLYNMFKDGDKITLVIARNTIKGELLFGTYLGTPMVFFLHNHPSYIGAENEGNISRGYRYSWALNISPTRFTKDIMRGGSFKDWSNIQLMEDMPSYYGTKIRFKMK